MQSLVSLTLWMSILMIAASRLSIDHLGRICQRFRLFYEKDNNCDRCINGFCSNYVCKCCPGFAGRTCEEENLCYRNGYCLNNAICRSSISLCKCFPGFTGGNCENKCPYFLQSTDRRINGYSIVNVDAKTIDACESVCKEDTLCLSYQFVDNVCSTSRTATDKIMADAGTFSTFGFKVKC